jgi:hypothetical protein
MLLTHNFTDAAAAITGYEGVGAIAEGIENKDGENEQKG